MSKAIKIKKVSTKIISFTLQLVLVLVLVVMFLFLFLRSLIFSFHAFAVFPSYHLFHFHMISLRSQYTWHVHYSTKAEPDGCWQRYNERHYFGQKFPQTVIISISADQKVQMFMLTENTPWISVLFICMNKTINIIYQSINGFSSIVHRTQKIAWRKEMCYFCEKLFSSDIIIN